MLSDGQLLLKAICADPDADLPRLVYADYLDDKGQPERAALVRLQVEFGRKLRNAEGTDGEIRAREVALWMDHGGQWLAELPKIGGVVWDTVFHRGFVERVVVYSDRLLVEHADAILALNPIYHLTVENFTGAPGVTRLHAFRNLKTARLNATVASLAVVEELLAWNEIRPDLVLRLRLGDGDAAHRHAEVDAKFHLQIHGTVAEPVPAPLPPDPPPEPRPGRRRRNRRS